MACSQIHQAHLAPLSLNITLSCNFRRNHNFNQGDSSCMAALGRKKFIFLKFQHDIPSNMGMWKWFFRDATKIQNDHPRSAVNNFLWAQKLQNLVRNYSNFTITLPTIWRCAGARFYWNSKSPLWINFIFFVGTKTLKKLKSLIIHIVQSHHPPSGDAHVILLKWPPPIHFLNICDLEKSNLIYDGGWYRTSGLLFCLFSKKFVEIICVWSRKV